MSNPTPATSVRVFTVVYVIRADGRILMMRRGQNTDFIPGRLSAPGGKVEPGEDILGAGARELVEETGLKAKNVTYRGCYSYTSDNPKNPHGIIHFLIVREFEGELITQSNEGTLEWYAPAEIVADASFDAIHREALKQLTETNNIVGFMASWSQGKLLQWSHAGGYYAFRHEAALTR